MSQQPQQPARASYQPEGEFGQEHKNQVEDLPSRVKGKVLRYKIDTKTAENDVCFCCWEVTASYEPKNKKKKKGTSTPSNESGYQRPET